MKPPPILSIRGGSWVDYAGGCRLAYRGNSPVRRPMEPFFILDSVGFRVIYLPPEVTP
jgi:formylglycine-generating enzyme required for sulfatase activity